MPPTITQQSLTFYYPTQAAPTSTVSLRAPEHGNRERIDRRQVIEETSAGGLIVFDRGPVTYLLDFDLQFVTRTQRDLFETLYVDTIEGALNTFELRVPKWWNKDTVTGAPIGGYLYAGCEFDMAGALEIGEIRDGYYSFQLSIRSTGRTSVA